MIYRGPSFSCGRMIRLHTLYLPPPSPVSKLDRRHTGRQEKEWQVTDGRGGGGGLALYKTFNTLWVNVCFVFHFEGGRGLIDLRRTHLQGRYCTVMFGPKVEFFRRAFCSVFQEQNDRKLNKGTLWPSLINELNVLNVLSIHILLLDFIWVPLIPCSLKSYCKLCNHK